MIYIYGSGSWGQIIHKYMTENGVKVDGFIEPDTINSVPRTDDDTVILALANPKADISKIREALSSFRVLSPVQYCKYFGLPFDNMVFWHTDPALYAEQAQDIGTVRLIWADAKSQKLYDDIIEYRAGRGDNIPPDPNQYHPYDVPRWRDPMRLIDCGAYDGDTIRELSETYNIEACIALEPDPDAYMRLLQYKNSVVRPYRLAAWNKSEVLAFDASGNEASHIADKGNHFAWSASIDDLFPTFAPTLIKMDIEGAEMEALEGAEKTITKYRPDLAIAVYHHTTDLWKIPQWVNRIGGYNLYLRVHANMTIDAVLYAIRKEKS